MRAVLSLLLACWLALLTAEPMALHACAMHSLGHGAHEALAVPVATGDAALTSGDADAHHAHHAVATDEQPASPTPDSSTCQCLGECCAAAIAIAPASHEVRLATRHTRVAPLFTGVRAILSRAADLRLPPSQAPPGPLTA